MMTDYYRTQARNCMLVESQIVIADGDSNKEGAGKGVTKPNTRLEALQGLSVVGIQKRKQPFASIQMDAGWMSFFKNLQLDLGCLKVARDDEIKD